MAVNISLFTVLLTAVIVFGQDDDLPFNTTGLTPIYVHKDGRNVRHSHSSSQSGSACNTLTFLPPGTSKVFTSPRYPRAYPPNQRCTYVFKSQDHSCNIQIACNFFQLPRSSHCSSVWSTNLFMKWGVGFNERKWCCGSTIPSTVVSSSYWAYAKFTSNWWYNWSYRGFRCTASTICPTTAAPTTIAPTTAAPTTAVPTTVAPTTAVPTTVVPTTAAPTTAAPTTAAPTTAAPSTAAPTTAAPTTAAPTTAAPTTAAPTTAAPTTAAPTTPAPTTAAPTTAAPTTAAPTTAAPTTAAPTTAAPTTAAPTTAAPTTP